ncbi:mycofactocin system glycosyltransferase [Actinomyces bovis]|uniref:Mycofactocin system glycosyltransferase n=1 Tax=Actinomyces bovis TaxID=1658 RepID=A0ABY1VNY9_9ACTO|nr:glycosyltransferase [Actinomyces bovis]SPT53690.1 mycofactocin system glycosyltransferase [Actinomyces bovis]VEG55810.1 mycofactocin system glycosyltransferase [Actinomyces israelii]
MNRREQFDEATQPPPRIKATVAVLTFHRPEQIRETVRQLLAQALAAPRWCEVDVLVVDNDPAGSGRRAVEALGRGGVRCVVEPTPGISAGRNRALDECQSAGRDVLLFMDDDGRPGSGWVVSMIKRWRKTKPAAVAGWVDTRYLGEPSPWILAGGFFERRRFEDGVERPAAACGNLLLDLEQVGNLRFARSLGLSGGEDTLFTRMLVARGGKIVFAPNAVVVDQVAVNRVTRRWVLQRQLSQGNSAGLMDLYLRSGVGARAKVVVGGAARMVAGVAKAGIGAVTHDLAKDAKGWRTASRGAGMALAGLGLSWNEYSREGKRLVRAPRIKVEPARVQKQLEPPKRHEPAEPADGVGDEAANQDAAASQEQSE